MFRSAITIRHATGRGSTRKEIDLLVYEEKLHGEVGSVVFCRSIPGVTISYYVRW